MTRFRPTTAAALTGLALLAACSSHLRQGAHWREVDVIGPGTFPVVVIDADHAQDRSVYDDAARRVAGDRTLQVGYFLPGDLHPVTMSQAEFASEGMWRPYRPVAIHAGTGYTAWDCYRAGSDDAVLCPASGVQPSPHHH